MWVRSLLLRVFAQFCSRPNTPRQPLNNTHTSSTHLVCWLPVSTCKLVGKVLSAHPVDRPNVVAVGDGCIAGLNAPHRLTQLTNSGRGVEHNLSAIQAKRLVSLVLVVGCDAATDRNELQVVTRVL